MNPLPPSNNTANKLAHAKDSKAKSVNHSTILIATLRRLKQSIHANHRKNSTMSILIYISPKPYSTYTVYMRSQI